jgi:signal transduction histidine kinase
MEGDPHDDAAELAGGPGVGLNLYLARVMTEQMGGRLTVTSEPGKGSIITILLPAWHVECVTKLPEGEATYAQPASGRG